MKRKLETLNIRDVKHLCKHLGTSPRELDAICHVIRRSPGRHYVEFSRTSKGKRRDFAAPQGRLREILVRLNALLQRLVFLECLHGGIKERGCAGNASVHVGKPVLLKFDIEEFFPNVKHHVVYGMFVERLGCRAAVAARLTRLTTLHGCLPQGSPTSTIVANLVLEPLARRFAGLAQQHGADYTQFIDDGTISGPDHLRRLIPLTKRIVAQEGFCAKESKTFWVGAGREQVVTGFRVNHQLDVPSEKVQEVRALVESLRTDVEQGHVPTPKRLASIEGKIRHISRINRGAGRRLRRRYSRITAGLSPSEGNRFLLKSPG